MTIVNAVTNGKPDSSKTNRQILHLREEFSRTLAIPDEALP
jgi:hypothetical protein